MNASSMKLVSLLALACVPVAGGAQEFVCGLADAQCWQREHEKMCRDVGATATSCSAWLSRLEKSPNAEHPGIRLTAAAANVALGDFSADPSARAQFRDRAREIYRSLVRDDPTNASALLGLSNFTPNTEERLSLMRRAVESNPTDSGLIELLGRALSASDLAESS